MMMLVWLAQSGQAAAATAFLDVDPERVAYVADAGETNDLTISSGPSGWVITDQGATITPGSGCASVTAHQVTCSGSALWSVDLGDGNDVLQFNASSMGGPFHGGTGDDRILGGDSYLGNYEQLYGDSGNDILRGRAGADMLDGGPGADTMSGGTSCLPTVLGTCKIDGDTVTYDDRLLAVRATADGLSDDGEVGEGDLIKRDIECLVDESGDDLLGGTTMNRGLGSDNLVTGMTLRGGPGDDVLRGGRARDWLAGGAGKDVLRGFSRPDFMFGQAGDDRFRARDGFRDQLDGGFGRDSARIDGGLDRLRHIETILR